MRSWFVRLAACALAVVPAAAMAASVNLSGWRPEGAGGHWVLQAGNTAVRQTLNGAPTVFYSDFNSFNRVLRGTVSVATGTGDDDFIGFVLGFTPGDLTSTTGNFLLIDWRQSGQGTGCQGSAGLAVSQVTAGLSGGDGAWCHNAQGVSELQRAATLGNSGWVAGRSYDFEFAYNAIGLTVWVDGIQQLSIAGNFADGRFGFYNNSQKSVTYSGVSNATALPEPSSWAMMMLGFGLLGATLRHRRRDGTPAIG